MGKVKALQHLLTHSRSGKLLAVKRVTDNRGKRTPGVDGKVWSTPMSKWRAVISLKHRDYRPRPFKVHAVRYADNFVVTGASKAVLE